MIAFGEGSSQSSILLGRVLYVEGWQEVRVNIADLTPDGLWQSLAENTVHSLEKIRFVISPDTHPLSLFRNRIVERVLHIDRITLK
mgnify:CR=1 FL=1